MKAEPYFIFELFCKAAAWDQIAQDDCVNWSPLRRKVTRWVCGAAMGILSNLWGWSES